MSYNYRSEEGVIYRREKPVIDVLGNKCSSRSCSSYVPTLCSRKLRKLFNNFATTTSLFYRKITVMTVFTEGRTQTVSALSSREESHGEGSK